MSNMPLRLGALVLALALYGAFGSPTPSSFGPPEAAIGILLAMAISPRAMISILVSGKGSFWQIAGRSFMIYGLVVSIPVGIINNHAPGLILRDVIPFFFLLLPLLVFPAGDEGRFRVAVLGMTVFIGVAFSARIAWPLLFSGQGRMVGSGADPLYLSIAPTVVFSAIVLGALAGRKMADRPGPASIAAAGFLAAMACLPFLAMAITLQRAGLVLAAAALGGLLALLVIRNPVRAMGPIFLMIAMLAIFAPDIAGLSRDLAHKHDVVGFNKRLQEAAAVADSAGSSAMSMLIGQGWGTTVNSPAVGGITVNYTHCLLTALWLKTGLVGLMLAGLYIGGLAWGLFSLAWRDPVMTTALAVPLAINIFLYASYKSLDFGLILLLTALYTAGTRNGVRSHNHNSAD